MTIQTFRNTTIYFDAKVQQLAAVAVMKMPESGISINLVNSLTALIESIYGHVVHASQFGEPDECMDLYRTQVKLSELILQITLQQQ